MARQFKMSRMRGKSDLSDYKGMVDLVNGAGSTSTFPMKLYALLESITDEDIACWTDDGAGFMINSNDRFTEHLPQFFKHKKLSSFQRQLNLYGFRRDKVTSAYIHNKFVQGRRDLIGDIRRVTGAQTKPVVSTNKGFPSSGTRNGSNGRESAANNKGGQGTTDTPSTRTNRGGGTRSSARLAVDSDSLGGVLDSGSEAGYEGPFVEFGAYPDLSGNGALDVGDVQMPGGDLLSNTWMNVHNAGRGVKPKPIRTEDESDLLFQSLVSTLQSMGSLPAGTSDIDEQGAHMSETMSLIDGSTNGDVDIEESTDDFEANSKKKKEGRKKRVAPPLEKTLGKEKVARKSKISQNLGVYNSVLEDVQLKGFLPIEEEDDEMLISRTVTPVNGSSSSLSTAELAEMAAAGNTTSLTSNNEQPRRSVRAGLGVHDAASVASGDLEIDDELLNLCESTCQAMADAAEAASKEGSGYDSDAGSDASAPVVSSSSSKAASEDLASESEESETKSTH